METPTFPKELLIPVSRRQTNVQIQEKNCGGTHRPRSVQRTAHFIEPRQWRLEFVKPICIPAGTALYRSPEHTEFEITFDEQALKDWKADQIAMASWKKVS